MDVKNSASVEWEGSEEHSEENLCFLREYLSRHKQNVSKNTNIKGNAGEGLEVRNILLKPGGQRGGVSVI